MKTLLLFITFIFCINAQALENWVCKDQLKAPTWQAYANDKNKCEANCANECHDVTGKDMRRYMAGLVDNLESKKYLKMDLSACSGLENCQTNLAGKDCSAHDVGEDLGFGVINADLDEAYCAKFNGYNQKPGLVADAAGIAQADADDAAKAAKDASEAVIDSVVKLQHCGQRALAVMAIQNAPKNLSVGQKKTLLNTYKDIKDFLQLGSLAEARAEVDAATPDGTIVTAADKTAILAKIDECLAL